MRPNHHKKVGLVLKLEKQSNPNATYGEQFNSARLHINAGMVIITP